MNRLLLVQMAALSMIGAISSSSTAAAIGLAISGNALPGWEFFTPVSILAFITGLIAALAAARRDSSKTPRAVTDLLNPRQASALAPRRVTVALISSRESLLQIYFAGEDGCGQEDE